MIEVSLCSYKDGGARDNASVRTDWRGALDHASQAPLRPGPFPWYRGWTMVGLGIVMVMMSVGSVLYGYSIYVTPVSEELGLSRETINSGIVFQHLGTALLTPVIGRMLDKVKVSTIVAISGICMGGALVALGIGDALWPKALLLFFPISFGFSGAGLDCQLCARFALVQGQSWPRDGDCCFWTIGWQRGVCSRAGRGCCLCRMARCSDVSGRVCWCRPFAHRLGGWSIVPSPERPSRSRNPQSIRSPRCRRRMSLRFRSRRSSPIRSSG